jgi:hypothetical protein
VWEDTLCNGRSICRPEGAKAEALDSSIVLQQPQQGISFKKSTSSLEEQKEAIFEQDDGEYLVTTERHQEKNVSV